jgi:small subunit ribosomal protein S17
MSRKKVVGKVISDRMQKTRIVVGERLVQHPKYKKFYKHRTKYYVHDEKNESKVGDVVLIEETRPLSKLKRWRLVKIISKNQEQ